MQKAQPSSDTVCRVGDVALFPKGLNYENHWTVVFHRDEDTQLGERVQARAYRVDVSGRQRVDPCLVLLPRVGVLSVTTRSLRPGLQLLRHYPRCLIDKEYNPLLLFLVWRYYVVPYLVHHGFLI